MKFQPECGDIAYNTMYFYVTGLLLDSPKRMIFHILLYTKRAMCKIYNILISRTVKWILT